MNNPNYIGQLSDPEYFGREEISHSTLAAFERELYGLKSPNPENYRVGSLFDCMTTTPDRLNKFCLMADGKEYSEQEFNKCEAMLETLKDTPYFSLCKGIPQACFAGPVTLEYGGNKMVVQGRCKVDFFNDAANTNIEIKTTVCTSLKQFIDTISFLNYDRAEAWYADLTGVDTTIIIGVSKKVKAVFPVVIRRGDETNTRGREKYTDLAWRYSLYYGQVNFETP